MLISWGPDYTMLYNDAYGVVVGTKHPGALGRSCREVLAEAWDFIGPLFDTVFTEGQPISTLTHQLFTFHRNNYLEECYFAFSYSPIPDDNGHVGGVLTNALDMTERVIEDRRRQVLRDLASRTAEARHEEEVWRVSAETLGQNRSSAPFAFLYEYRPGEQKACLASVSAETDDALHPAVIDCNSESIWRFRRALAEDCLVVALLRARIRRCPSLAGRRLRAKRRCCQSGCASAARRQGSWCWESIRAASSTTPTATSSAGSPNKSPSGWPARARTSRSASRAEALAEIDRAKTAFFSNVSHEFRTPLALMLGPLEEVLPEARERLSPERHEQLVTVRRNAFRLLKLVNTLLDFSRIEAGRVQAVYEPTDLASVTSEDRERVPFGDGECRPAILGGMPATRRTGVRGPGHVGEGGLESSLQRVQVHVRGRRDGHVDTCRAALSNCRSAIPGWEFPRTSARGCSSAFIGSRALRPGPTKARGSDWRSFKN